MKGFDKAHKKSPWPSAEDQDDAGCQLCTKHLAANFNLATTLHNDLYFVTAAGPSVSADLTTEQAATPANLGGFGAATGYANRDGFRAAAARWLDAQRCANRWWRTATATAIGSCRLVGRHGNGAQNNGSHGNNRT